MERRPADPVEFLCVLALAEDFDQGAQIAGGRGFIQRHTERIGIDQAQIDAAQGSFLDQFVGAPFGGGVDVERVEKRFRADLVTEFHQHGGQVRGHPVHPLGDLPQPLRPVVNGVHRGHDGEQDLRGADVARGFVAADVLLAGLEREPHGGPALRVMRDTDEPSRHVQKTRHEVRRNRAARRNAAPNRRQHRRPVRQAA